MNAPRPCILSSDLDGTLIPLAGNKQNQVDLATLGKLLKQKNVPLLFVTGRHLESVQQAIEEFSLPQPDWIICDVGSTICHRTPSNRFEPLTDYYEHQSEITGGYSEKQIQVRLKALKALRLQETEKQGRYKLSYYVDQDQLPDTVQQVQEILDENEIPWSIIHSVDPFNGDGLLDLLPLGVSKSHALQWWCENQNYDPEQIIFAGDSGNDLAALIGGYRAIIVANAPDSLRADTQTVHEEREWTNRLYLANHPATSGILEGCRNYGMF